MRDGEGEKPRRPRWLEAGDGGAASEVAERRRASGAPEPRNVGAVRGSASIGSTTGPDLSGLRRLSQNAKPQRRERDINMMRLGAFLLAAAFVIAVPWLIFTRIGDSGPARPRPSVSAGAGLGAPSPSASASIPPPVAVDAGVYEVVGEVACARIRVEPGTNQEILNCVKPGTTLRSDGQIRDLDGFSWLHDEDPYKKIDGWIATEYVKKVST